MVEMMSRKKEMLNRVFTIEPTPRVERLRQRVLQSRPTVEIDKACIQTKVMKQTEGEPMVTRIAKAFAAVVRGMPIRIFPDELIVGFEASSPRAIPARPESGADLEVELDTLSTRPQDPLFVSEEDKKVLRLVNEYLKAGVMINGVVMGTEEGTPQGSPLSPLLSNIVLTELDRKLEERGHRFVRYADDCNIYVKSERAAKRVLTSTQQFIEERMRLKVNEEKSAADRATKRQFLSFSFY